MQVASAPTPATIANGGRACLRQGAGLARFPDHVAWRLAEAMRTEWHRFWPDDISLLDAKVAN